MHPDYEEISVVKSRPGQDSESFNQLGKEQMAQLLNAVETRLKKKEIQKDFYSKSIKKMQQLGSDIKGLTEITKMIEDRKIKTVRKNFVNGWQRWSKLLIIEI